MQQQPEVVLAPLHNACCPARCQAGASLHRSHLELITFTNFGIACRTTTNAHADIVCACHPLRMHCDAGILSKQGNPASA
jgi:hypothetical protein